MKGTTYFLLAALCASALTVRAAVDSVAVRQNWPWSNAIKVYFTISGVTEPVDASLAFTAGGQPLSIPDEAIAGRRHCLDRDGTYVLTIDPEKAFGSGRTAIGDFVADVTIAPASAKNKEVLYKAFRLADNTWTDITRGAVLNGDYGTFETDYGKIGTGYTSTLENVCIWTGVTNDTKWATDYIVLRKIPAGNFTFTPTIQNNFYPTNSNLSTITYDYWIGVFPMTQAQYQNIYADGNPKATVWLGGTGSGYEWQFGNVYTNALAPMGSLCTTQVTGNWKGWHRAVTAYTGNQCFFARLFTRSGFKFRCPSSFEWIKACRSGAPYRSYYYDGISQFRFTSSTGIAFDEAGKTRADYAVALGRFSTNGDGTPAPVGSYRPNAYGLYDMIGNICEPIEDTFRTDDATANAYISPETMHGGLITDLYGATDDYNKSISGGWYGAAPVAPFLNRQIQTHSGQRKEQVGLRICISDEAFQAAQ